MAQDDMHVIIYKLLAYLYDCMKKGKSADAAMLDRSGPIFNGIPEKYRCAIISEVSDRGYVTGLSIFYSDDSPQVLIAEPGITLDGVEYMFENSMMQRALRWLQDVKSALPFI